MNERFEKIATEVFFDEATNGAGQKMYTFGELKMQKFAEAIVQECIEQVEVFNVRMDARPRDIVEAIQQHFGVKSDS